MHAIAVECAACVEHVAREEKRTSDSHEAYDAVEDFRLRYPQASISIVWDSGEVTGFKWGRR